jgi:homoserine O-succinyltransferase/O-acetyltransferase
MPLLLDTARTGSAADLRGRNCLTIGLVNNMPDAACEATERQFLDLLRAVTSDVIVCLKLFAIGEVPPAEAARQELAGRYHDIAELWDRPLDGLIVTGTEPRTPRLEDEPYWPAMTRLARENTASTVWSCLAAHAAVLHVDRIERRPLVDKLSGVFDCEAVADHPLLARVGPRLRMPHSRIRFAGAVACRVRLSRSYPLSRGRRRCVRWQRKGAFAVPLLSRPSGIRH